MMNIKPSAAIRKNYNEISELCKRSGEPVYLTKNGEGDLVVMDIETYARRESMLRLRENLVVAEEGRLNGKPGYSIDEVSAMMKSAVREVLDGQRK
ncbi:MAG: prevent-host-death protein [Peptococcaceae bacterium BRH_c23]|nr:type II toxin-antitoxin system prevent-host-death family antitoxin [Desulfosporosinus sp. BICA1-9]KJS46571.1 MAG: prevent-host-death protein [Peptococcaceae bacterium BRH_c23]KJS86811.1 MAG: prevent-host-death protein [Desulfosporosinus sp. BICA1-9]